MIKHIRNSVLAPLSAIVAALLAAMLVATSASACALGVGNGYKIAADDLIEASNEIYIVEATVESKNWDVLNLFSTEEIFGTSNRIVLTITEVLKRDENKFHPQIELSQRTSWLERQLTVFFCQS